MACGIERRNARGAAKAAATHLTAAAQRESQPGHAALAVAAGRILVEAHQMRADALTVGGHRRGRGARADRRRGRRLTLGARRRAGARRRRRLRRLLGVRPDDFRLHRHRLLLRHDLGGLGLCRRRLAASAPAAPRPPASPAAGSARSAPAPLPLPPARAARRRPAASRVPARCPSASPAGDDVIGAMSTMIAGIVTPGSGRWRVPVHANRDQRRMRGHDRGGRSSPAPDDGLVGNIVQRERVHGASCGRRGRPARS